MTAYHTNYSDNSVSLNDPFTITVVDPCDSPTSVVGASLADQEYTITDDKQTYTIPVSTPVPSWCAITYTYTVTGNAGQAITFTTTDPTTPTFDFLFSSNLDLSGSDSTDYTVTVTSTIGNVDTQTDTSDFKLTIKNPCVDPTFVQIVKSDLASLEYIIGDNKKTFAAHPAFTLSYSPNDHTLCGDIAYVGQFENVAVDDDPMFYTTSTRVFAAESRDMDLLENNPRKYQVVASLANYQSSATASTVTAEGDITFKDPCVDTFGFSSTSQTNPASDNYSGNNIVFTLTPFTLDPSDLCTVTYSCKSVSNVSNDSSIGCDNLVTAGKPFDSASADVGGTITVSVDTEDY